MITLYPAIDLKKGQVVRLFQGDFDKLTVYAPDPGGQAKKFADSGCEWIHVVDLDGAVAGESRNNVAVKDILKTGVKVQLGGGIRTMKNIETLLSIGISRVVLGTVALKDPELVKEAASSFPGQIAVGADAREGMVAAEGWLETSQVKTVDLVRRFEDCGVAAVIFTDITRDGALTGVNVQATSDLASAVSIPVIASGGVRGLEDISACAALAHKGLEGVITGRALYDGRIDLKQALAVAKGEIC